MTSHASVSPQGRLAATLVSAALGASACTATALPMSPTASPPSATPSPLAPPSPTAMFADSIGWPSEESTPVTDGLALWTAGRWPGDVADMVRAATADLRDWLAPGTAIVIEGIDQPGRGAGVVTALTWRSGTAIQRWAVGISLGAGGAQASGDRWPIVIESIPASHLEVEPVTDVPTIEMARHALATAGWAPNELTLAAALDAWPYVATFTHGGATTSVWLRRHLHQFVVAGTAGRRTTTGAPR